jgi:hypothetical protein
VVRHVLDARHVGRLKVSALKADLEVAAPDTRVEAHPLDVVMNADRVRPLIDMMDIILCAADGVQPRRVLSHLARRARRDAVLACVLEDGGLGEILRLRPWHDRGCLSCEREALEEQGLMNPEPMLDAGYGTGTPHRPMTAVPSDLHIVGQLAAKVTVATLLGARGHHDQWLAGDHLIFGLRPRPGWPAPFDVRRAGEVHWIEAVPPLSNCPTCDEP